jgi:hypothetical protein
VVDFLQAPGTIPASALAGTGTDPAEFIWAHWKHHELPNVCPENYYQLSEAARRTLLRMRRRPRLITAFWQEAVVLLLQDFGLEPVQARP